MCAARCRSLWGYDVLHPVDPGELDVDTGELGGVPGGERGLGPEYRSDLEDPVQTGRGPHQLRRVQLGAAVGVGELAHRLLGRCLHREDQPGGRPSAQVQVPPVLPAFGTGVLIHRQRSQGAADHLDRGRDDLQTAERDDRVGHHPPGDDDR